MNDFKSYLISNKSGDTGAQCPKIDNWVREQRRKYRLMNSGEKSFINNDKIVQLENVVFQWISDSQFIPNITWNEQLSELLQFKQQWGHCDVPQKYAKDSNLSNQASQRRHQHILLNSGKKSFINNGRIAQ